MARIFIQGQEERQKGIHYEVDPEVAPLGEGGTGIVRLGYMVNDVTGEEQGVAIKFLYNDLNAETIERSRREASIRISNDNLIRMIGFVQVEEEGFGGKKEIHNHVVSELLHGVMLSDLLDGKTSDDPSTQYPGVVMAEQQYRTDRTGFALSVIRQVLSAIQALHDYGYIHRDIDPSNIMITENGNIKLIDLGIAKKISELKIGDHELTKSGTFIGKAHYAAPELALGDVAHQNKATDIYAVGILLYQLIVGHLPFDGSVYEVLDMQCSKPIPLKEIENKGIRNIVKKATSKKAADRYQSAAEFRVALDGVSNGGGQKGFDIDFKKVFTIIGAIVAVIAIVAIIFVAIKSCGGKSEPEVNKVDTTSVNVQKENNSNSIVDNKGEKSSTNESSTPEPVQSAPAETKVEKVVTSETKTKEVEQAPAKAVEETPKQEKESNGGSVGYGHFSGKIKNGKPNGVGKLTYSSSHTIDSRDPQGRVAEAGDYVKGEWSEGRLIQGRWYDSSGNSKGMIIIGQ